MTGSEQVRRWTLVGSLGGDGITPAYAVVAVASGPSLRLDESVDVVPLSDLQREIAAVRHGLAELWPKADAPLRRIGDGTLDALVDRLGIDVERKD